MSVDSGDKDALYRIRRSDRGVVYVTVLGEGFLSGNDRNHGPTVLAQLRKLKEWGEPWTTLCIHVDQGKMQCERDTFPPSTIPKDCLLEQYPLYDIASLVVVREYKSRTSKVAIDGQEYFLKIARFPCEIQWVIQEIQSYHKLSDCPVAPKLVAYVYETCEDRVVGFLTEKAEGRFPGLADLEACRAALDQLHRYLIHGDLVKYNIIVTSHGPKFIDFESSVLVGTEKWSSTARDKEKKNLEAKLVDESGAGRPW